MLVADVREFFRTLRWDSMALNWLSKTTYAVVETRARVFPDQLAVLIDVGEGEALQAISFAELHVGIQRTARRLSGAGVRLGTHMAIWADNSLAWLECWLGASLLGAVTVAVNPRLTAREAGALMEATDVGHLLAGGRTLPGATELVDSRQAPETTLAIDGSPALPSLERYDAPYRAAPTDGQRVGLIQFTSGSTGMPKGVQLREGAVAALGACCASRWLLQPGDRLLGVFSLSHNAGTTFTAMPAFAAGAALGAGARRLGRRGGRGGRRADPRDRPAGPRHDHQRPAGRRGQADCVAGLRRGLRRRHGSAVGGRTTGRGREHIRPHGDHRQHRHRRLP